MTEINKWSGMMKLNNTLLLLLAVVALAISCNNRNSGKQESAELPVTDTASIFFREYKHDFGRISEGEKVGCIFTFENKGTGPLIILSAETSCGCTVPKYDRKPIQPGETGTLEVIFDSSGRNGIQTKTISVRSNATKPVVILRITGEVINSNNN